MKSLLLVLMLLAAAGCHSTGAVFSASRVIASSFLDDLRDTSNAIERMRGDGGAYENTSNR